jgi:predicted tellurium resistance membrane protein TerC
VLRWGIFGAIVLRGLFITLGAVVLQSFRPVLLVFAGILMGEPHTAATATTSVPCVMLRPSASNS